jgi:thioredoxin 1
MGAEAGNGKEGAKKKVLDGTGLPLPGGSSGSVRSAGSDSQLRQMLDSLKSSKSPVSVAAPCASPSCSNSWLKCR